MRGKRSVNKFVSGQAAQSTDAERLYPNLSPGAASWSPRTRASEHRRRPPRHGVHHPAVVLNIKARAGACASTRAWSTACERGWALGSDPGAESSAPRTSVIRNTEAHDRLHLQWPFPNGHAPGVGPASPSGGRHRARLGVHYPYRRGLHSPEGSIYGLFAMKCGSVCY